MWTRDDIPCRCWTTLRRASPCIGRRAAPAHFDGDSAAAVSTLGRMADEQARSPALVPELDVSDLGASLRFYCNVIGFTLVFERPRERFAYLALGGVELMLQDAIGPGRRFRTAALEPPFGRGINLQIAVPNVDEAHQAVLREGMQPIIDIEERWYEVNVVAPAGRWT